MRSVIGAVLVVRAASRLWTDPPLNVTIFAVLSMAAGILLIVGLWTPIVGTSVALIEVCKMIMLSGDRWVWLLLGTAGAALAMLGPGLWSIDARLFGWKRIETLTLVKKIPTPNPLPQKRVILIAQRVCVLSRSGVVPQEELRP